MAAYLPPLLDVDQLAPRLDDPRLLIIDLGSAVTYQQAHVPGAVHVDYGDLVASAPPVGGLLPPLRQLAMVLGASGYTGSRHVVVYDDEGGGNAARLVFTLDALGLDNASLLNGGLHSWANEGYPLSREPVRVRPTTPSVAYLEPMPNSADANYIIAGLERGDIQLLDVRSPDEFHGRTRFARRGGHIPGAVNLEWTDMMDHDRNLRLLPAAVIRRRLDGLGLDPAREVVTYCQTHHRSAFSYLVLKLLGYRVRGYPGSWSDWGNRQDTPVET